MTLVVQLSVHKLCHNLYHNCISLASDKAKQSCVSAATLVMVVFFSMQVITQHYVIRTFCASFVT